MTLQSTPEAASVCPVDYHVDQLLGFVIDGWLTEQAAKELTKLPHIDRASLSANILGVSESDTSSGEQQRAEWAAGILARETLSQTARTVFVETASLRPQRERKQGLGSRAWTDGRHSSPETSAW